MDTSILFTQALQLHSPWYVEKVEFVPSKTSANEQELHIYINFKKGATFCVYGDIEDDTTIVKGDDGKPKLFTAYDTVERTWRHLNFFQFKAYIHARVPRVKDGCGHCSTAREPWARPGSGFTLLF